MLRHYLNCLTCPLIILPVCGFVKHLTARGRGRGSEGRRRGGKGSGKGSRDCGREEKNRKDVRIVKEIGTGKQEVLERAGKENGKGEGKNVRILGRRGNGRKGRRGKGDTEGEIGRENRNKKWPDKNETM